MSEYTQLALTWLRGIDPATPVALLIIVVLLAVYSIRRWLPKWWLWVESTVPFVDSLDTGPMLTALWAAWQAWPAMMLGAALSALAAGASVQHALWGALCGAISAVVHVIMSNYKGLVGAVKPPAGPYTPARSVEFPRDPKPPSFPPPRAATVAVGFLACMTLGGCALFAAAAPYLAEAAVVIGDAINDLDLVEGLINQFPGLSPASKAALDAKLAAARVALQAAAAADSGAQDLTAEQLDASLAAFRTAWKDLSSALADAGIVSGSKFAANGINVAIPVPLALRRVQK